MFRGRMSTKEVDEQVCCINYTLKMLFVFFERPRLLLAGYGDGLGAFVWR